MTERGLWDPRWAWWLGRAVGFGLCIAAFTGVVGSGIGTRHATFAVVQLAVIAALLAIWAAVDLGGWHADLVDRRWLLLAILVGLAVTGGLTADLGLQSLTITYSATACYFGGELRSNALWGLVLVAGVVGVELSGVLFGFEVGAAVGWPLLLVTCVVLGRIHQQSRERGEHLQVLMEQMRLSQERDRHAAAIEERHRIAREIHDVLAHSLSALGIQIEAARSVLVDTADTGRALGLLERAQSLADQGLTESREAIHALRSDSPPLPEALAGIIEARNRERPGRASLAIEGAPIAITPEATVTLIRVANEALANAANHAPSSTVELRLGYGDQATTLQVVNASAGPGSIGGASGYGLAGMGERVRMLGGSFAAGPSERGWAVTASIPR